MRFLPLLFALACASPVPADDEGTDGGALPPPSPFAPGAPADPQNPGAPGSPNPGAPANPNGAAPQDFCEGTGALVKFESQVITRETCAGEIAEMVFRQALCACGDVQTAGYLRTRGYDSREQAAPGDDDESYGGSVGINGTYKASAGYTNVGGSLSIAGFDEMAFFGFLQTGADLRLGAKTTVPGYTKAGRDAWIGADFTGVGPMSVERDLHKGANVFSLPLSVGGQTIEEPVRVTPPCPCNGELVDLNAAINTVRVENDNAAIGLQPNALSGIVGHKSIELPCGRYYLNDISGVGDMEIRVTGRVALMVGGSFKATGHFDVEMEDGAELDLFVGGNLELLGYHVLGDPERPFATRVYVAGHEDVVLIGASAFVGNLYAPNATVRAPGYLKAFGSIFAKDLQVPGYVDISYDRAVADLDCGDDDEDNGDDFNPDNPPGGPGGPGNPGNPGEPQCERCGVCTDGLACVDGECGACNTDSDCCQQSICDAGRCRVI